MPTLSFLEDEIEPKGDISATVNPAGLAYVGRKHKGKTVRILIIREIDPEARGLLYRLQAEQNLPNLAETIKFLVKNYYTKGVEYEYK